MSLAKDGKQSCAGNFDLMITEGSCHYALFDMILLSRVSYESSIERATVAKN
jgi:hypothetical protein